MSKENAKNPGRKYVALLRGIGPLNPNMRNEKLRELFESLGFSNVQTVISSGNVLFESDISDTRQLEDMIEKALPEKLGFSSKTIIRSKEDLKNMVAEEPFGKREDTPQSRFNVTFLKNGQSPRVQLPFEAEDKSFAVLGMKNGAVFSVIDLSGTKTPAVMLWLEKQFTKEITTRTWKTVLRILKKFESLK